MYFIKIIISYTGEWVPVAIAIPTEDTTAICLWEVKSNADYYRKIEHQILTNHPNINLVNSIVESVSISKLEEISSSSVHELIALEPTYSQNGPSVGINDYWKVYEFIRLNKNKYF